MRLTTRRQPCSQQAASAEAPPTSASQPIEAEQHRALTWAQRLKRVFAIEIEICRGCGGRLRVIASIEAPPVIARILEHLGRSGESGESVDPARRCPRRLRTRAQRAWGCRRSASDG